MASPPSHTHTYSIISISLHLIRDIIIIINEWYSPRSGYGGDSGGAGSVGSSVDKHYMGFP